MVPEDLRKGVVNVEGRRGSDGLEVNLRLIALVYFVVGMLVVLMVANTPLSADEDFWGTDRGALNALTAVAAVLAVATLIVP